jgi:hypothetical protein
MIAEKIRAAFAASDRAQELRNGQPFMPLANLVSDVDMSTPLMSMEVPRETVVPVKTVGAGQFGLVFLVHVTDAAGTTVQRAAKVLRAGVGHVLLATTTTPALRVRTYTLTFEID